MFDQCALPVFTYEAETLTLSKRSIHKLQVDQRAIWGKNWGITLKDRVSNFVIRKKTRVTDVVQRIAIVKWTKTILEWRPRYEA